MSEEQISATLADLTADIVSAYVTHNRISAQELPAVIQQVHAALGGLTNGTVDGPVEKQEPAVSVRKSITPDFLISLEDGRKYKTLKRHLGMLGMTPSDYRAKWGLPTDYPMVSPNYSAARSAMAKAIGLGVGGRGRRPAAEATAKAPTVKGPVAKALLRKVAAKAPGAMVPVKAKVTAPQAAKAHAVNKVAA
jgi:predicted transcriptional regulator